MKTSTVLKKFSTAAVGASISTCILAAPKADAGVIFSPTSGIINSGGPGFGTLTETINQAGLLSNFVSGVTDFDTYLATNPLHTPVFPGNEWFSNSDTTSASVTYDLGPLTNIDRLALWNEESSGIGTLDLFHSSDGINFAPLALGLKPTDNPLANYPADVFSFASVNTRYIRFDMSDCPQPNPAGFPSCAIGEVAFRKANVPEPASVLGLLAIGALGAGAALKRKLK
jgi:hypothetical protein